MLSRAMIQMFDSHFPLVTLWYQDNNTSRYMRTYRRNLQDKLNIQMLNSVLRSYMQIPWDRRDLKKVCSPCVEGRALRESIKTDFRILAIMLTSNPFYFGNEPTIHDLQAFSTLAQLRFLYKEIQYPIGNTLEHYYSCFYFVSVLSPIGVCGGQNYVGIRNTMELHVCLLESGQQDKNEVEKQRPAKQYLLPNTERVKAVFQEYDNGMCSTRYETLYDIEEGADENKENNDPDNDEQGN